MYRMSRMLSTHPIRESPCFRHNVTISANARSGLLLRKDIVSPFRPQKVQWCFAPHQHARVRRWSATKDVMEERGKGVVGFAAADVVDPGKRRQHLKAHLALTIRAA